MPAGLSPLHVVILLVVVLLVVGPSRLPELGKALGTSIRGFREAVAGQEAPSPAPDGTAAPAPDGTPPAPQQRP